MDLGKAKDMSGMRFGMLLVLSAAIKSRNGTMKWLCRCDCGKEKVLFSTVLNHGQTSCGCQAYAKAAIDRTTHGMARSPEYRSWRSMLARCGNKRDPMYDIYGGRGIKVCERWLKFENFYEDMGERLEGMTLDRIDGNKGYEPENCQWASAKEQARNRSTTVMIDYDGESMAMREFARRMGVSSSAIKARLRQDQTPEEIAAVYLVKKSGGVSTVSGATHRGF